MNIFAVDALSVLNSVNPLLYYSEGFTCIRICILLLTFVCKPQEKEQNNHKNQTLLSGSNIHYKVIFWLKIFFFPGTSSKVRKAELSVCSKKMSNCCK